MGNAQCHYNNNLCTWVTHKVYAICKIITHNTVLNLTLCIEKNFNFEKRARFSGKGRQSLIFTRYENL